MPELARALEEETGTVLGPTLDKRRPPLRELFAEGQLVVFRGGGGSEYAATGALTVTLADLLARAETAVDPSRKGTAGRRPKVGSSRQVEALSKSQWRAVRAVVHTIAAYVAAAGEAPPAALWRIGLSYFVWDERGGAGQSGEWTRFLSLAREASEAKHGPGHGNLHNDIGAARTLLDLAASRGWIARTARHAEGFAAVPAEWAPLYATWRESLLGSAPRIQHAKASLLQLLGACAAAGLEPATADWERIARYLEEHWRQNAVPAPARSNARRAYRALREAGLIRCPFVWPSRLDKLSLVPTTAIAEVAEAYGCNTNTTADTARSRQRAPRRGSDRSEDEVWHLPDDRVWARWLPTAKGLVEGEYGLRRWLEYQCVPDSLTAQSRGLPARGVFPREVLRTTNRRRNRHPWRAGTVHTHGTRIVLFAGWLALHRGIDFSVPGADLRVLLDEAHLIAYRAAVLEGQVSTRGALRLLVISLARIASPYLEAVAHRMHDTDLADKLARVACLLDSPRETDGFESWGSALQDTRAEQIERSRAKARAVEAVITRNGALDTHAYNVLVRVRDALIGLVIEAAGERSLDEQLAALVGGTHFGREWAWLVQAVQYLQDQLIVPLRTRSVCLMTLAMRTSGGAQPHLGRLAGKYPGRIMKSGRPFEAEYLTQQHNVPGSAAWTLFDPRVYGLFLLPGGARDILLTDVTGQTQRSRAFYVPDLLSSRSETGAALLRWTPRTLAHVRRRIFDLTAPLVGHPDSNALEAEGVLGNHASRHAFGTRFAPIDVHFAASHLDHSDFDTTRRYYCAKDASNLGGASRAHALMRI